MKKHFLIFIFFVNCVLGFSQNRKIDSLIKLIQVEKVDSQKISLQSTLLSLYVGNNDTANFFKTFRESYALAERINYTRGKVLLLIRKSNYYTINYDREKGKEPLELAENMLLKIKDVGYLGRVYFEYSIYYRYQDDYSTALKYTFKSLKINELIKDTIAMANCYGQIGNIYRKQKEYLKAKEFYVKAFIFDSLKNSTENYGIDLSNLGLVYSDLKEYELAIYYLNRALVVKRNSSNTRGVPNTLNILGSTYLEYGKPKEALACLQEALQISRDKNEPKGIAISLINIAEVYQSIKEYQPAITYFKECIDYAKSIKFGDVLIEAYEELSKCYAATNNFDLAYKTHINFTTLKDSMFDSNSAQQIIDMKTKYDTEKKEEENKLLQTENKLSQSTIKQQKIITYFIVGGLLIVSLLAFFIFKGLKNQRQANAIIIKQKEEVHKQKEIIEEHQKETIDSINYAKKIQYALLAQDDLLKRNIQHYFILFNPKDIVSGDFYWATEHHDKFYLAVCDSTGHGVPGAFMSLLNMGFLSEAIKEKNINKPNEVLNYVRTRLVDSLGNDGQKDGMDAVLMCFDRKTNLITYSAANNEPILISNNQIIELEKDKMPVGKGEKSNSFVLYSVSANVGDTLYLYTDGYADQFGGPKGKKYKYKQLNDLLLSISTENLNTQKDILQTSFNNWKENLEQVDDVLIVGIKI